MIITAALGYEFDAIRRFVTSFKNVNETAKIVLFVSKHGESFHQASTEFGNIEIVEVAGGISSASLSDRILARLRALPFHVWPVSRLSPSARRELFGKTLLPYFARYVLALEYLEKVGLKPNRVLISDSRDVFFQANPFEFVGSGLYCGRESVKLFYERFNYNWMRKLLAPNSIRQIEGNIVSCSGVTIGDYYSIISYLNLMEEEIAKRLPRIAGRRGDQALHNWIVYTQGERLSVRWADNGGPLIFTAGTSLMREVDVTDGTVRTLDGRPVAIVHQYKAG